MDKSTTEMVWMGIGVTIAIVALTAFIPQVRDFVGKVGTNINKMIDKSFSGWDTATGDNNNGGK